MPTESTTAVGLLCPSPSSQVDSESSQPPAPPSASVPYTEPKKATPRLVKAKSTDLKFVDSLQKKFGRSLGFLPRMALEKNIEDGNVHIATENEDNAGYLLVRPILGWRPEMAAIIQAAVCMDAQRRHLGLALLLRIEHEARRRGQVAIQANCAIGVEANEFWQAAGFKPIAHMTPDTKSGRELVCWRKPLQRNLPLWFMDLPTRAGHRCRIPHSTRNLSRSTASHEHASQFLAAKLLPQGNPVLPTSGIISSESEEGKRIMEGL